MPKRFIGLSKLTPPLPGRDEVAREALWTGCSERLFTRVCLVQAPPGYGKTVAMAQLYRQLKEAGEIVVWLQLDAEDNEINRFLMALDAALQLAGLIGDHISSLAALSCVAKTDKRFTLFFDQLENIVSSPVLDLIQALINYLPPLGHIVMATRIRPKLAFAELEAYRRLRVLGAGDLAFTLEEARKFHQGGEQNLNEVQIARLHRQTEGWPVGIVLGANAFGDLGGGDALVPRSAGKNEARRRGQIRATRSGVYY